MIENENVFAKKPSADGCAARQSAASVLLERANRLRRQAGELHLEADRIEQLGHMAQGIQGHAEEALWRLAINYVDRSAPRLY